MKTDTCCSQLADLVLATKPAGFISIVSAGVAANAKAARIEVNKEINRRAQV